MSEKKSYIDQMKDLQGNGDTEMQHAEADEILCRILIELGHQELVKEYYKVNKWYA